MTIRQLLETLTVLIPLPPFLAFVLIVLFFNRWKRLSHSIAIGAIALSFLMAQTVFWTVVGWGGEALYEHPIAVSVPWLPSGEHVLSMGVMVD
ncbi:MAG TPA: hypothetical protein ENK56_05110, partial [Chloroflexi bacterium]|nr:hypothetical protein [Chloroflexota bacterium]